MDDSDIDITDLLSETDISDGDKIDVTAEIRGFSPAKTVTIKKVSILSKSKTPILKNTMKPKRIRNKPKVRTRPQSAISANTKSLRNAMKRFEQIQRVHTQTNKKKKKRKHKYNPNQWFDATELKSLQDFRDENYQLRSQINDYKNDETQLKSQVRLLEKQNLKRSKEIQALITVALQNNKTSKTKKKKFQNRSGNNKQRELLMQLRHEQSIHVSLRNKIKKLKKELKTNSNKKTPNHSQYKLELNTAQIQIKHLRQENETYKHKLSAQSDMIENIKINERERNQQMESEYKKLIDDKMNQINCVNIDLMNEKDLNTTKLQNECEKFQNRLNECSELQQKQSECIAKYQNETNDLKEENSKYKLCYELMQKLGENRNQSENGLWDKIVHKLMGEWNEIIAQNNIDLQTKVNELIVHFEEMEKTDTTVNNSDVREKSANDESNVETTKIHAGTERDTGLVDHCGDDEATIVA